MSTYLSRGAWPSGRVNSNGADYTDTGGTLRLSSGKTVPGPHYRRPVPKTGEAPGKPAQTDIDAGRVPDLNEHAVWFAVLAVKVRLQEMIGLTVARRLDVTTGVFGGLVDDAVREFQDANGLTVDGIVGPGTAKALFEPVVHEMGAISLIGPRVGCGIVTNESAYDPGAVGRSDLRDHGLCQLNADSQGFSLEQSFHVRTAVRQMYVILDKRLSDFGNIDDAIAAYNLGPAGARLWISEGRPEMFLPLSQRDDPDAEPRNVHDYIDRIKSACTA